jgi:hypothetical protein
MRVAAKAKSVKPQPSTYETGGKNHTFLFIFASNQFLQDELWRGDRNLMTAFYTAAF